MTDIDSNLICRLGFDEASGTAAINSGSDGIDATLSGTVTRVSGIVGSGAVKFTGANDYVTRNSSGIGSLTNEVTLFAKLNVDAAGFYPMVMSCVNGGADHGVELLLDASTGVPQLRLCLTTGVVTVNSDGGSIVGAGDVSVCGVYDGVDARIYINGALACTPVPATDDINVVGLQKLRIGNRSEINSFPLGATVDEVRIYARALDASEAAALDAWVPSDMTIDALESGKIFQFSDGTSGFDVSLSGDYDDADPDSIEVKIFLENSDAEVDDWTALSNQVIGSGHWSGDLHVFVGGMYNLKAQAKNSDGDVIHSSDKTSWPFGVGALFLDFGESNQGGMFSNTSGQPDPHAATRMYDAGEWKTITGAGARSRANALQAALGMPIGLLPHGVGGSKVADWTDPEGTNMAAALAAIAAVGGDIMHAWLWIGINDAIAETSKADMKTAYATITGILTSAIAPLRDAGSFAIGLTPLTSVTHDPPTDADAQAVLESAMEYISRNSVAFCAGYAREFATTDGLHLNATDLVHVGLRAAQASAFRAGAAGFGADGAIIVSGSRVSGTDWELSAPGLDDTGEEVSGIEASQDNFDTLLELASVVQSADKLSVSTAGPTSGPVKFRHQYGKTPDVSAVAYTTQAPDGDSLPFPLQPKSAFSAGGLSGGAATKLLLVQSHVHKRRA